MAKTEKSVRLMKCVKINGEWRWCRLAVDKKDRPKPDVVIINGLEQEKSWSAECPLLRNVTF